MADEFERSLVEMGLIGDEVREEDVHNDLVIEALLGSRLVELQQEEEAPQEAPQEAPLDSPSVADAPSAPSVPSAPSAPSAPAIEGELHDMISLLAEGKDIGAAPASELRERMRRGFADRIERKRAGYADAAPKPHTPRTYAKKLKTRA